MADEQQGPNLEHYSGTGEDLTEEQRQYLKAYALHETENTDQQQQVAAVSLPENAEGEWA